MTTIFIFFPPDTSPFAGGFASLFLSPLTAASPQPLKKNVIAPRPPIFKNSRRFMRSPHFSLFHFIPLTAPRKLPSPY